ncbi:MAG: TonB-dependent receptor plug domain-containing protein [Candidatus Cryptobacteroides sp.]
MMKRTFPLVGALLFLPLCLCSATVVAEVDSVHTLESVSVRASRVPMTLGTSARIVTVMDSMAIASLPAKTVNDLLKHVAGVDVRQRGPAGMQTDISMRGGTSDQIAVLLNGINISDPQTGHNAADFPVSLSMIERIEILEGPSSRVYGTSSLVGAVNIVTKKPDCNSVSASLGGGSFGTFSSDLGYTLSQGRFGLLASAGTIRTDGYSKNLNGGLNSDFAGQKYFLLSEYEAPSFSLTLQGGYSLKDCGSNTFYSSKYDDQFEHTEKSSLSIMGETKGRIIRFKPSAYWNYGFDRFELFRGDASKVPFNYHRTNTFGSNLEFEARSKAGLTSFGAEFRHEGIVSTNLGEPLAEKKGEHYTNGLSRSNLNFYAEHSLVLSRFTVSGGLCAVMNSGTGNSFGLYPGIDMSLRFADNWKVYASYNSSFRLPTFTELYYSVGGHQADPELKPERMQSLEGGIKYYRPGVSAVLSLYYHHGSQMIDWIRDFRTDPDPVWQSVNHTVLNTLGEEVSLRFDLPLITGIESFPIAAVNLSFSHIDQDKSLEEGIESRYALEYLRNKAVAEINFRLARNLFWDITFRYIDRNGTYEKYDSTAPTGTLMEYEPYCLLDSRIVWAKNGLKIYLEGENLLDRSYYDYGNIPQPGIWMMAGLSYTIGL